MGSSVSILTTEAFWAVTLGLLQKTANRFTETILPEELLECPVSLPAAGLGFQRAFCSRTPEWSNFLPRETH